VIQKIQAHFARLKYYCIRYFLDLYYHFALVPKDNMQSNILDSGMGIHQ